MSTLTLMPTKMRRGVWEGVSTNTHPEKPQLSVTHLNKEVPVFELTENKKRTCGSCRFQFQKKQLPMAYRLLQSATK